MRSEPNVGLHKDISRRHPIVGGKGTWWKVAVTANPLPNDIGVVVYVNAVAVPAVHRVTMSGLSPSKRRGKRRSAGGRCCKVEGQGT